MENSAHQVTQLLKAAEKGDRQASEDLLPIVYDELRRLAEACMARTPPGQTLQPTALVHEAFLRLVEREDGDKEGAGWSHRGHFFFAAGRAMRDILVERARARASAKRGGSWKRVELDNLVVAIDAPGEDLLALDDALRRLEQEYPWEHRIVTLRFFAGLTNEETAQALNTPLRTIERDWRFARAWLNRALAGGNTDDGTLA